MNLRKIIAAALSLTFVAGVATNLNNYAPNNPITVNAEGAATVVTTTAVDTIKANTTTTPTSTVTTVDTTIKATTSTSTKAVTITSTKPISTSTSVAATTTAKTMMTSTAMATSTSVVTSTTSTTTVPVAQDYSLGDVNNDGHINAVDASSVLSYYAMISTNKNGDFDDKQKSAADVNNDGSINAVDASCILSYYAYVSTTKDGAMSIAEFLKNGKKTTLQFAPSNPLMNAYSALQIGYADNNDANSVTSDLKLCNELEGAKITWSSDKPDVIATNGSVTRSNETKNVKLTATIRSNEESLDKEFEVRVIKNTYDNYNTDYLYDMENLEHLYIYNDDEDALKVYLNDDGYIKDLNGKFSKIIVESPEEALLTLYEVKSLMGCDDPKTQLVWYQTSNSKYSYSYKFRQVVDGIPVYGRSIVVSTDLEGNTTSLHSPFISKLKVNTNNILSEAQIKAAIEKEGYSFSYTDGKYIYPNNDDMVVVYKVCGNLEGKGYDIIVDAHTGDIILKLEKGAFLTQKVSGNDALGNPREIDVNVLYKGDNLIYTLDDLSRNIQFHDVSRYIGTDFESGISNEILANSHIVKERNEWSPEEISASINVKRVYDFYNEILGRKGFDNKNSLFHMCINWWENNAFGGGNVICFGHYNKPAVAGVDGVGHEFTHTIVECETNLTQVSDDSVAPSEVSVTLNEAYADILGILAEAYANNTDPDWVMADDVSQLHVRNIKNPHDPINIDIVKNKENGEIKQILMPMSINDENYFNWKDNDYKYSMGKDDGAHHNSTIISYPCYLMWKNGIQDTQHLAELWYTSLTYGYDAYHECKDEQDGDSDDAEIHLKKSLEYFQNVRNNVLNAARVMRVSSDEYRIIEAAFDEVGITDPNPVKIPGSNVVLGKIVAADNDMIISNNAPVENANIILARLGTKDAGIEKQKTISDNEGNYSFYELRPGNYVITVSCPGYIDSLMTFRLTEENQTENLETIELIPEKYKGKGTASGFIKDAVTGKGVDGLTLQVREGMNNTTGEVKELAITGDIKNINKNKDGGDYEITMYAGNYCIEVKDERVLADENLRYKSTCFNIKVLGGETISTQNATVELEKQNNSSDLSDIQFYFVNTISSDILANNNFVQMIKNITESISSLQNGVFLVNSGINRDFDLVLDDAGAGFGKEAFNKFADDTYIKSQYINAQIAFDELSHNYNLYGVDHTKHSRCTAFCLSELFQWIGSRTLREDTVIVCIGSDFYLPKDNSEVIGFNSSFNGKCYIINYGATNYISEMKEFAHNTGGEYYEFSTENKERISNELQKIIRKTHE